MMERDDSSRHNAERMGHGVYEGMNAGRSRNAHTQGESIEAAEEERLRREAAERRGEDTSGGAYATPPGHTPGTHPDLDAGDTSARTRPEGVGHQAESGMETDPYEGMRGPE